MEFTTERLDIRPLLLTDAEDVYAIRSLESVAKWGRKSTIDKSLSETVSWIQGPSPKKAYIRFAIREKHSPRVIGTLGVNLIPSPTAPEAGSRWEIGYGFHTCVWGRGYATEAVRGFMGVWGALRPALEEGVDGDVRVLEGLFASADERNERSGNVLRKCGFEVVGGFVDEIGRRNLDFGVFI
ncbi:GNAT domain-containing protein [Aspergillus avenaceus]|uniref:GNAT domain-containing protein n=1 Tax=Aspergillus avenaceus TaxID=36643 RepID=A0A5N6TMY1_ASPAV|nr:GNAT domain-containing protein [Aspergillus avenaceus]